MLPNKKGVNPIDHDRICDAYFEWMVKLVCEGKYSRGRSWRKLLRLLHETEFVYILDMDSNRAEDGIYLRHRFAYDSCYDREDILRAIDNRPCSVLEMMAALAFRCEESITGDCELGNRTGQWFFEMIESLGLIHMYDARFDKIEAADILVRFMRGEYSPSGQGGLFTIGDISRDLRELEIWDQMMLYLNENIYGRKMNR